MIKLFLLFIILSLNFQASAQLTPFEQNSTQNVTATYSEAISFYQALDKKYAQLKLITYGLTDIGIPLHLAVLSRDGDFDPAEIRKKNKTIILINNGIHPGEPEGIDASMMLARNLLKKNEIPANVVICIVPIYNVDGSLNRGNSRINQNGPENYGFRGNYQNLDLNRDFIKSDSKNSISFQQIFNFWRPEILIDNHTSNGSDYQYVITLIQTQKDKLNPILSGYMTGKMVPYLYTEMEKSGFFMSPYVNNVAEIPDNGIEGFLETPRYSTGYAALHNVIGFMPETHMLKTFSQRVKATYLFMQLTVNLVERDSKIITTNKKKADLNTAAQTNFTLNWKLDTTQLAQILFKGYEARRKKSEVTGFERLYYDRNAPFEKQITLRDKFVPALEVQKPIAYVVPQSWEKVIQLLKLNGVEMKQLKADSQIDLDMYYIADYKTVERPYEGHYVHSNVLLNRVMQKVQFYKGDFVVYVNQVQNRYIVETLEPQGDDSFFAWNFFDSVLGRKEGFSAYVFEDEAAKIVRNDPRLLKQLEEEKLVNPELTKSGSLQLNWIYKHSIYYEKTHSRYPVGRLMNNLKLDLK
ncbi:MAG: hypothetical protein H7096_11870 [Flavobacterium sp.]|nr:hypothetical protein [Pedobacter sp.]